MHTVTFLHRLQPKYIGPAKAALKFQVIAPQDLPGNAGEVVQIEHEEKAPRAQDHLNPRLIVCPLPEHASVSPTWSERHIFVVHDNEV